MRPVKVPNEKNSKLDIKNALPRVRKKRLKRKHRNRLLLSWQTFLFSSFSYLLIHLFINQGWQIIDIKKVIIIKQNNLKQDAIINITKHYLPERLIRINPKQIESDLIQQLPIKAISIRRKILPAELMIEIQGRDPIAFATKIGPKGIEKGMVDFEANWIPIKYLNKINKKEISLKVEGWSKNQQNKISYVLKNNDNLGSPLKKIILNSAQEMSLQTEKFKSVLLGRNPDLLKKQINYLSHLDRSLPDLLINTNVKTLDLTDPSNPEIKLNDQMRKDILKSNP